MSKNFHRDYADSVGHFCQSIPASLGISAQEIDTYFRACTLCLWAVGGEAGGNRGGDGLPDSGGVRCGHGRVGEGGGGAAGRPGSAGLRPSRALEFFSK